MSMVMLLVAGALALAYFVFWGRSLLFLFELLSIPTSSGGIGSVSGGVSESFVQSVPILFSSFLLWRVCASLAANGDRVMTWHRRFHGVVAITGLLFVVSLVALFVVSVAYTTNGSELPVPEVVASVSIGVALGLVVLVPPGAFALTAIQLYSTVVAFKALRRGQHAS